MSTRRTSALVAVLAMAASLLTLGVGPAVAEDPPPVDPPIACKANVPRPAPDGRPLANAPIPQGTYFSFPNRSAAERGVIMNRVINTINSTWGFWYSPVMTTQPACLKADGTLGSNVPYISGWQRHQGTIRMATWTFNHWGVRDALVRAEQRGVSVQLIAATGVNRTGVNNAGPNKPWFSVRDWLRKWGSDSNSYAWECGGACRGGGGAPHSKYFLFTDVGSSHLSSVVVQTSMNLTTFAVTGQWNQATAIWNNADVYNDFSTIFEESKAQYRGGYRNYQHGSVVDIFFPKGAAADPVLTALNRVQCTGATSGGINGRTRIRVIQYAIHGARGNAIAKKLRGLWNAGCNVAVIYSITSRPVLKILRSRSGRGRVPMKQSVIKNRRGEIVKYNHSKWLGISGNYGGSRGAWFSQSGSSNWSDLAYTSDEQMQEVNGYGWTRLFFATFDKTWRQKTSRAPRAGGSADGARMMPAEPTFGRGIYKYMSEGE